MSTVFEHKGKLYTYNYKYGSDSNKPRSIFWSVLCSQGELDYITFMNQI